MADTSALVAAAVALRDSVDALAFAEPTHTVYNPLRYAWEPHLEYLERFGAGPKEAVFLGMNPGPWGMAQTGVPFGEIAHVRDWMGISASVGKPDSEHPKRPIEGFDCARSEVSGRRLWGFAAEHFGTAEEFFSRFFVLNYCPLVFMEASARNRTPDKLPAAERAPLEAACDDALRASVAALSPSLVIGVGAWAEKKAKAALANVPNPPRIGRVLHPSPASPKANKGWAGFATSDLAALGIDLPGNAP
ncbi:MAG: single-stranded DNA-binding protein [Deltaproteobacteria bacterium]|nr:single-stranded DNA-binding protein [Deltaproteobacteria bacterium]